jgi:hypothetical protein
MQGVTVENIEEPIRPLGVRKSTVTFRIGMKKCERRALGDEDGE